jgi:hypothetical protein
MLTENKSIFLDTLIFILNEEKYNDSISWLPEGTSFIIHDVLKFTAEVLPEFFKHKNFSSFHRQLNLYGFTRDKNNKTEKVFYHPKFKRNRPELLEQIHKKAPSHDIVQSEEQPHIDFHAVDVNQSLVVAEDVWSRSEGIDKKLSILSRALDKIGEEHLRIAYESETETPKIERANDIITYIVEWIKNNPNWIEYLKLQEKLFPMKGISLKYLKDELETSTSGKAEESFEDSLWQERIYTDDVIQF